ncbi:MAG: hypothetical protein HQK55_18695 [Deltaproteobacteria bacterium]|nr:hypothetical protein [Deltaproteobacteria bacterium]
MVKKNPEIEIIVTQGPYSTFLEEVAKVSLVSGIRLNTIMPIKEGRREEKLREMHALVKPKNLWVDLKARQLRIREFANTPYTAVTISHRIKVNLPAIAYFDNGHLTGKIVDLDGHKLIIEDYIGRLLGPGESVNIVDESLEYLDSEILTPLDETYVDLCRQIGLPHYMLSFVESPKDVALLKARHPGSMVMAKIENLKGLAHLPEIAAEADFIMAARGDLYTEIAYPHEIGEVLEKIFRTAPDKAVIGSRILESLLRHPVPSCADMMDLNYLIHMGYRRFLIGDDLCFKKDLLMKAMRIFAGISKSLL